MTSPRLTMMALAICLGVSTLGVSATASAQSGSAGSADVEGTCDPKVAQDLMEKYKARQKDLDESKEGLLREIKKVPEQSIADLSSCVDLSWPTMTIQYPTMDQIIRGIAKEAVRKACGAARDAISEQRSRLSGSYYFNTRIPGVPNYGVSSSGTGSGGVNWPGANSSGSNASPITPNSSNPTGGLFGGGNKP